MKHHPSSIPTSTISSNLSELQSHVLLGMGVQLDDTSWIDRFIGRSGGVLCRLVSDAIDGLETASHARYDQCDWITLGLDRHDAKAISPSASVELNKTMHHPTVLYSYWLLHSILTKAQAYLFSSNHHQHQHHSTHHNDDHHHHDHHSHHSQQHNYHHHSNIDELYPHTNRPYIKGSIDWLTSAETFSKLLSMSTVQNLSLRYCIYDLNALILSNINIKLSRIINHRLYNSNSNDSTFNGDTNLITIPSSSSLSSSLPPTIGSEYYITIAKERSLLQMFGSRMKIEASERKVCTRFTRALGGFLYQWHLMRRLLGMSSLNYMNEYLIADLSLSLSSTARAIQNTTSITDPQQHHHQDHHFDSKVSSAADNKPTNKSSGISISPSSSSSSSSKEPHWMGLRITQLSSSSATVDWSLDASVFAPTRLDNINNISSSDKNNNNSNRKVTTFDANLYFTAASHMGLEMPVLVLSNLEATGTFHIDDLEADTLYKITISKEKQLEETNDDADGDEDDDDSNGGGGDDKSSPSSPYSHIKDSSLLSFFNGVSMSSSSQDQHHAAIKGSSSNSSKINGHVKETPSSSSKHTDRGDVLSNNHANVSTPVASIRTTAEVDGMDYNNIINMSNNKNKNKKNKHINNTNNNNELVVFIATESEASFKFDMDQLSPHIIVTHSHCLTLRNQANKKWSTARASVRLTTGLHRWDVHIDRCVSKNIFIGVASKDARLDNYVGCDKFGWAFLANKAIWHNKSKLKAYGELFRTGDTVTVILDLDLGTLSYALNNKPMGVAVEGLTGPLYPAFSLYNEDDQISIMQLRTAGYEGASSCTGSCAAERTLERIASLSCLMSYVISRSHDDGGSSSPVVSAMDNNNHHHQQQHHDDEQIREMDHRSKRVSQPLSSPGTTIISDELCAELLLRWQLWRLNLPVRSFLVGNDYVTICAAPIQCSILSQNKLSLWDVVLLKKEHKCMVVGVGEHRLWMRAESNGELHGYTADAIRNMFEKGSMKIIHEASSSSSSSSFTHLYNSTESACNQIFPITTNTAEDQAVNATETMRSNFHMPFFSFEISASALKEVMIRQQHTWSREDDTALFDFINITAKKYSCDPFSLNIIHILQKTKQSDDRSDDAGIGNSTGSISGKDDERKDVDGDDFYSSINKLSHLQHKHSVEDVAVRALVLIHMNDIALPLLPLICPYSNSPMMQSDLLLDLSRDHQQSNHHHQQQSPSDHQYHLHTDLFGAYGEAPINHPTSLLKTVRELLFPLVSIMR